MQVGRVTGCFRRSGGGGGKGAASVVVGDLSLPTWRCPPISGDTHFILKLVWEALPARLIACPPP